MQRISRAPLLSATLSRDSCWITCSYLAFSTTSTTRQRLSLERGLVSMIRTRSPTRQHFPPETILANRERAIQEVLERQNVRRNRTYPRVHKKGNRHAFPTKTPHHVQERYDPNPIVLKRTA